MSTVTWEATVARAEAPGAFARAAAASAVVVASAAGAHTWAGGDLPTGPGLVLVAAVVTTASVLVLRRAVPAWAMLPVVALAQLGVHESFGLAAAHDHTGHAGTAARVGMPGMTGMTVADDGSTARMIAAHLVVTAITALLWWAGRRAGTYVVVLRLRAHPPVLGRSPAPRTTLRPPALVHLLVSPRRGPPVRAYAA